MEQNRRGGNQPPCGSLVCHASPGTQPPLSPPQLSGGQSRGFAERLRVRAAAAKWWAPKWKRPLSENWLLQAWGESTRTNTHTHPGTQVSANQSGGPSLVPRTGLQAPHLPLLPCPPTSGFKSLNICVMFTNNYLPTVFFLSSSHPVKFTADLTALPSIFIKIASNPRNGQWIEADLWFSLSCCLSQSSLRSWREEQCRRTVLGCPPSRSASWLCHDPLLTEQSRTSGRSHRNGSASWPTCFRLH